MAKTTITSTKSLSCLTSAISGAVPSSKPSKPDRSARDVVAGEDPSFFERVKRTFTELIKGIGIADVPGDPLILHHEHHDKGKEGVSRPLCIPPSWSDELVTKACECMPMSKSPCMTTTVTRTTSVTLPTVSVGDIVVIGAGKGGVFVGRDEDSANAAVTKVVTNTVTNTVTKTAKSTVTKMETVRTTATSIAGNGLSYKRYTHKFDADKKDSDFAVSFFKRRETVGKGTLGSLSWSTPKWPASPGKLTLPRASGNRNGTKTAGADGSFDALHAAVMAQGFFVAHAGASTYVFEVPAKLSDN